VPLNNNNKKQEDPTASGKVSLLIGLFSNVNLFLNKFSFQNKMHIRILPAACCELPLEQQPAAL
jgi:hypothetical protein